VRGGENVGEAANRRGGKKEPLTKAKDAAGFSEARGHNSSGNKAKLKGLETRTCRSKFL